MPVAPWSSSAPISLTVSCAATNRGRTVGVDFPEWIAVEDGVALLVSYGDAGVVLVEVAALERESQRGWGDAGRLTSKSGWRLARRDMAGGGGVCWNRRSSDAAR